MNVLKAIMLSVALVGCAASTEDATTEPVESDQAAMKLGTVVSVENASPITVVEVGKPFEYPFSNVTHSGHASHAPPDGTGAVTNTDDP